MENRTEEESGFCFDRRFFVLLIEVIEWRQVIFALDNNIKINHQKGRVILLWYGLYV